MSIQWVFMSEKMSQTKGKQTIINNGGKNNLPGTIFPFRGIFFVSTEIRELLDSMERDPLLRHELLVYFYKYKKQQKQQSPEVEDIKD
jgi:hypothetical protein